VLNFSPSGTGSPPKVVIWKRRFGQSFVFIPMGRFVASFCACTPR
jgi:hypothetical protein